jgi:uncharacterized protein (TIGR00299 family) protein
VARILYFDCFSGISGDMVLGAFLDLGLPLDELRSALGSLALPGVQATARRVLRSGVSATKFDVQQHPQEEQSGAPKGPGSAHSHSHDHGQDHQHPHSHSHSHGHRSLREITSLIDASGLSMDGRERAKAMFRRLAEAEAAIHQMAVEDVHLHEVGSIDSIIDIVGAVYAMEWAGVDSVRCSPLNIGGGTVRSAHGVLPVPAPATLRLLEDAPIYSGVVQHELVTPTGALIATTYASSFGSVPAMSVERVGYGAGERDHHDAPNVLRVLIGRSAEHHHAAERVTVIECEIDDMNSQLFGVAMERLYAAGALEVFYAAVQMKKNRPGVLVTVIAPPEKRSALADIIFRETTTIGLRYSEVHRECLERELVPIETPVGLVRFKVARHQGRVVNAVPEFEDCAKLAAARGLSVKEVQSLALQAYGAVGSTRS